MINYKKKYQKYKTKYLLQKGGDKYSLDKFLYKLVGAGYDYKAYLYIPEDEFNKSFDQIFLKYDLNLDNNSMPGNKEAYNKNIEDKKYIHIKDLSKLFLRAKEILHLYLPNDDINYMDKSKWFERKDEGLRRIYSHHYEKILVDSNREKYSKIKFPERIIRIKNEETGIFLSREETIQYINNNLKIGLYLEQFYIDLYSDGHRVHNFTTFIDEKNKEPPILPINHEAYNQIRDLCMELETVDYTNQNVHFEGGIVYVKDLKNKGQNRCPEKLEFVH